MNTPSKLHTFNRAVATLLILTLMIQPSLSQADDSPSVDAACSSTFANASTAKESDNQKLDQCKAGKSAQNGYQANDALWKVWAAVSAFCGAACAASVGGVLPSPLNHACTVADITVAVADAIVTKEYMSILSHIMGVGMSVGLGAAASSGKGAEKGAEKGGNGAKLAKTVKRGTEVVDEIEDVKKGSKSNSVAICLMAVMAGATSAMKFTAAKTGKDTVRSTLDSIAKYQDNRSVVAPANMDIASETSGMAATGGKQGSTKGSAGQSGPAGGSSSCAQGAAGGNGEAVLQCAQTSAASSMPGLISDPQFEKSFQDTTGIALNNFLANATTPASAISAGMSNKLTPSQGSAMEQLLQKMTADAAANAPADSGNLAHSETHSDGSYSSGGGGAHGAAAAEAEPDMMAMMAGIMSQFG
ncbi:MAG: hypothetical protein ABI041_10755, partial [Bdellovibrionia bacterium]